MPKSYVIICLFLTLTNVFSKPKLSVLPSTPIAIKTLSKKKALLLEMSWISFFLLTSSTVES